MVCEDSVVRRIELAVDPRRSVSEPVTPDLQGEFDLEVKSQQLGLTTDWLPASEILGEGVFIRLDEEAVRDWEERPQVRARGREQEVAAAPYSADILSRDSGTDDYFVIEKPAGKDQKTR